MWIDRYFSFAIPSTHMTSSKINRNYIMNKFKGMMCWWDKKPESSWWSCQVTNIAWKPCARMGLSKTGRGKYPSADSFRKALTKLHFLCKHDIWMPSFSYVSVTENAKQMCDYWSLHTMFCSQWHTVLPTKVRVLLQTQRRMFFMVSCLQIIKKKYFNIILK